MLRQFQSRWLLLLGTPFMISMMKLTFTTLLAGLQSPYLTLPHASAFINQQNIPPPPLSFIKRFIFSHTVLKETQLLSHVLRAYSYFIYTFCRSTSLAKLPANHFLRPKGVQ